MSTEDYARIQWVRITNEAEREYWWPAIVYDNFDEALRLSSTDTAIVSALFARYWSTYANKKSISIAFLLGNNQHSAEKYVFMENKSSDVLPFYHNFGQFYDESNESLKSAINEAVDRIRLSSDNNTKKDSSLNTEESMCTPPRVKTPRGRPKKCVKSSFDSEDGIAISTPSLISPQSNKSEGRAQKSLFGEDRSVVSNTAHCSIVERINPCDSWKIVWDKLRQSGWTYKKGKGTLVDFYYVPPNGSIPSGNPNAVKGKDYFTSEDEVKAFVQKECHWKGEPSKRKIIPDDFSTEQDLWSKMKLLGWRHLEDRNIYVAPGAVIKNGVEGVDYFRSWRRVQDYIAESCDYTAASKKMTKQLSNVISKRKKVKSLNNNLSARKSLTKKSPKTKSLNKNNKTPAKKTTNSKYSIKTVKRESSAQGHEMLLEDQAILKPNNPLHHNFTIISNFLNNVFDASFCSSNPKLMHVYGGSGKVSTVTMAAKEFSKNNPKNAMTTLYYNAKRKSNKDLTSQISFILGLSVSAKPVVIEKSLNKSDRMLLTIVDEADILFCKDASSWKNLFDWAYSCEHNFAMIIISNSSFDKECASLIPEGSDLDSKPNLFFPMQP